MFSSHFSFSSWCFITASAMNYIIDHEEIIFRKSSCLSSFSMTLSEGKMRSWLRLDRNVKYDQKIPALLPPLSKLHTTIRFFFFAATSRITFLWNLQTRWNHSLWNPKYDHIRKSWITRLFAGELFRATLFPLNRLIFNWWKFTEKWKNN